MKIDDPNELIKHLSEQNDLLKSQLMNTSLIHELTKVLHSCTDFDSIINTIILAIRDMIEFDRIILFNINKENFCLEPRYQYGIDEESFKSLSIPLGFDGGEITDAVFLNRHILVETPDKEDLFFKMLSSKSYLVIPLVSNMNKKCWEAKSCTCTMCQAYQSFNPYCWSISGSAHLTNSTTEDQRRQTCIFCSCFKVDGVLWMDKKRRDIPISSDDISTLSAILNMAGIVINNFRILKDLDNANTGLQQANSKLKHLNHHLRVAQAKIRSDLEHARSIQQGLLPHDLESTSAFSLGARYFSADAVGGDYYDVFSITPEIFGLVVADVSGHGIASALIMSMVKILLKTFAANEQSPQKTLERINQTFISEVKTDNFVTIFYAILNSTNHTISYTSAGHCPILLFDRKAKTCSRIKADGLFLGVFPDMMLSECNIEYEPGNVRLLLYTDGIIEAKNSKDEMFGVDNLITSAMDKIDIPPQQAVDLILEDQKKFCGEISAPDDDITILVIDL